jgi:hypothetical protein
VQRPHGAAAGTKEEEVSISQTTLRIGAVLGIIGAIVVLAASAQAATSKPAEMSQPEYRALMIRSEALNRQYGLASGTDKPAAMGRQEDRALVLRSKALNAKYDLEARVVASTPPAVTVVENGFVWGDFAIGAAAMLGLVLLSAGLVAGGYFGRKIGVRPRSVS